MTQLQCIAHKEKVNHVCTCIDNDQGVEIPMDKCSNSPYHPGQIILKKAELSRESLDGWEPCRYRVVLSVLLSATGFV